MRIWQKAFSLTLSALILTTTLAYADQTNPGTGSNRVRVMNVDSGSGANVSATYFDQSGNPVLQRQATVNALGSVDFDSNGSGLPDGFVGSFAVDADHEVAEVKTLTFTGGTAPVTVASYPSFAVGAQSLFFPLVEQRDTVFSRIAIQNASNGTANVQLLYYNRDGSAAAGVIADTIPQGGEKVYDLSHPNGSTVPTLPRTNPPGDGWNGGLIVRSDREVTGAAVTFLPFYGTAYPAAITASRTLYYPSTKRRFINGNWAEWCANVVQNVPGTAANILVIWTDRNGNEQYRFSDVIPAFASHGYNSRYDSNIPDHNAYNNAIGNDSNGAFYIISNQDVVGLSSCQVNLPDQGSVGQYTYLAQGAGNNTIYGPQIYRTVVNGNLMQRSGIIALNPDFSPANVSVSFRNPDGGQAFSFTDTIPGRSSHGYNTGVGSNAPGGIFAALGNNFSGQVLITSDRPLIGTVFHVLPNEGDGYNMYGR